MNYKNKLGLSNEEDAFIEQMKGASQHTGECDLCKDAGYRLNANGEAILCICAKEKILHNRYTEANIPKAYFDKTITADWNISQDAFGDDLGPAKLKKKQVGNFMTKYINILPQLCSGKQMTIVYKNKTNKKCNSLLITGGQMSGKTLLASTAVMESIKQGFTAKIYDWLELVNTLSAYEYREEQDNIAEDFETRDLMVIDGVKDYGSHSPCFLFQLDRISRLRLSSSKPIIITCYEDNYSEMQSGPAWKSLLANCYVVKLPTAKKCE